MATAKKPEVTEDITIAIPKPEKKPDEVRVRIKLPLREEDQSGGLNIDHFEHVTIANEHGETCYRIKRGEYVDVTIPVFEQLRNRYPDI